MNKLEFIALCNSKRKANKNSWSNFTESVEFNNGKSIKIGIKFYNTWVQIIQCNNFSNSSGIDISVKQFNTFLIEQLDYIENIACN